MKNKQVKELALALLHADTEQEVIKILTDAAYWDDSKAWRPYGDRDGNYATIGNQQSRPEAALVEKIINSVDARLMNECLVRGIHPTSEAAPPTIRHAVARFFENREPEGEYWGMLEEWSQQRQLEEAQYITVTATGLMPQEGNPSLTIADCGDGQTPKRIPKTFVSINEDNKARTQFVQGKFNMGGTGALKFCGKESLQLIITRRNPDIVSKWAEADGSEDRWGLTIVRRERPKPGAGQIVHSVYRYLAPVGADSNPNRGDVLSFEAAELDMMPDANRPYCRPMRWGSVLKLYEYDMKGFRSHVLRKGLLSRLELLLPGIALPVRVHEGREYKGEERSYANTLVGVTARLAENRAENLESEAYPTSVKFTVRGERMTAQIYAFKGGKADAYRTNEAIIFTINGQTHGSISKPFFTRKKVKMGRLANSLLVVVDCSDLTVGAREDLFMTSRDRLSKGELRYAIEAQLEELIGRHPGLRELANMRKAQDIAGRLSDSRPLEEVLGTILKSSPTLESLFLRGQRLSRPHPPGPGEGDKGDDEPGPEGDEGPFKGRQHPTKFHFHQKRHGENLTRNCELGRKCRIKFETDVENEYLSRSSVPGHYHVEVLEGPIEDAEVDHSLTLHNGIGNWSVTLPDDRLSVGDEVTLQCTITDDTLMEPFVNIARLKVKAKSNGGGVNGKRKSRGGIAPAAGIAMPVMYQVRENDSNWKDKGFDERTACKTLEDVAGEDDDDKSGFSFYVNMDNIYLRTDMKRSKEDVKLMEAQFLFANVLVGLALIHEDRSKNGRGSASEEMNGDEEESVEAVVEKTTRALAPFLLPMINNLGALSADEVEGIAQMGDED